MDVLTERPMAEGTTMEEKLDREERGREAAAQKDENLNFPTDVPKPVSTFPEGFGLEGGKAKPGEFWTEPVREDAEGGEIDEVIGEFAAAPTEEEKDEVIRRWKLKFPDEEYGYELDDPITGSIEYGMLLADLRGEVLKNLGKPVEGYEGGLMNLSEVENVVIETGLDISMIRNRRIREVLRRLGGEEFVRDIWTNAEEMTLVAPANERAKWVMQLMGKPGENGKRKLLAMTLSDWERMLVVRDDSDLEREVRLPDPGDGSYEKALPLVRSLFKLNFRGKSLSHDLRLSREFLH